MGGQKMLNGMAHPTSFRQRTKGSHYQLRASAHRSANK